MKAGEANSTKFAVGTATIMIGPMADLMNLNKSAHSVGLAKNIVITAESSYLDLTQGVRNSLVYQVMNGQTTRVTAEVYEMTAKNLTYGLGLDGSGLSIANFATTLAANIAINGNVANVANAAGFAANDWLIIQPNANSDDIQLRKAASIATNNITLSANVPVLIQSGAIVKKVNAINVGGDEPTAFMSMKIAGALADNTPIVLLFPKVRVTKGFTVGFQTDNYGNLPFEIAAFDQVPTDPFYSVYSSQAILGV